MPGPRQPTDLVKARGKKHFSQTEEDQRRDQEVHVQPPDPGGAAPVAGEEVPR